VRLKHQETASHLHRPVRAVSPANPVSTNSSSAMTIVDRALGTPPTTVDEALGEVECQRELIAELMHSGQPTEAAELALNGMLREFASMVEYEHDMLEEFQIKRSA
jgi:hypothetical protein